LLREGYDVECADTVEEGWALLQSRGPQGYQLVITDMRLPDGNGLDLLRRMDEAGRREKAIIITAYGSPENAVEALKAGAYDYLTKPVDLRQFRAVVASALGRLPHALPSSGAGVAPAAAPRAAAVPALGHPALARIVGESVAMEQVRAVVERVSRSMAPVLIQGESGTGKELVARAIHEVSPRAAAPFVAVNCGAIPDTLLEAEFFGYRKGAFTGATADRDGFFQAAQGGTLFLDEIGDLPLAMQSKLLRVIQERAVRPLGSMQETPLNVRIVSATHRELGAEVQAGRFRQDLFYRLNVIRIDVPPLRERIVDLPDLCSAVLARIAEDAGVSPPPTLLPDALRHLQRYSFPGNVRELENLLHRALALAPSSAIGRADLPLPDTVLQDADPASGGDGADGEALSSSLSPGVAPVLVPVVASTVAPSPAALPSDLAAYLDGVERDILQRALERHRYNRTAAGASLGLSLRQMRYRMARLGVGAADAERAESLPRADAD
jgi:two-component system response regulator PilR (NtrC family)